MIQELRLEVAVFDRLVETSDNQIDATLVQLAKLQCRSRRRLHNVTNDAGAFSPYLVDNCRQQPGRERLVTSDANFAGRRV